MANDVVDVVLSGQPVEGIDRAVELRVGQTLLVEVRGHCRAATVPDVDPDANHAPGYAFILSKLRTWSEGSNGYGGAQDPSHREHVASLWEALRPGEVVLSSSHDCFIPSNSTIGGCTADMGFVTVDVTVTP